MKTSKRIEYITQHLQDMCKGIQKNEYIEIRFVNIQHKKLYSFLKQYCKENNILLYKSCCIFVQEKDVTKVLPLLINNYINNNSKICYSVTPRVMIHNSIKGDYEHIKHIHRIYFDIEYSTKVCNEDILNNFVERIIQYNQKYNLYYYTLIHSGGGRHLLYTVPKTKVTERRKEYYKNFIKHIQNILNTNITKVDAPLDFTRVLGLPGTLNPKRNKIIYPIQRDIRVNEEFRFNKRSTNIKYKQTHTTIQFTEHDSTQLQKIQQLLLTPLPEEAPTNNVVFFAFKVLLSKYSEEHSIPWDSIVKEYKDFVKRVEKIQQFHFPMNKPNPSLAFPKNKLNEYIKKYNIKNI